MSEPISANYTLRPSLLISTLTLQVEARQPVIALGSSTILSLPQLL